MFELIASMDDPINFSIGQAHFDAPEPLVEAACKAIRDGANRYTVTQGIPELNERILDSLERRSGFRPPECFVTSGVSGGIMLSFLVLLNPGDEILLPDPNFIMYRHLANLCEAEIKYYDLYPNWRIDPDEVASLVTEKTKVIFLNSPSNPTGGVMDLAAIEAVVRAAERVGAWVISDEIYDAFVYDGNFASPIGMYDRVLQLGGFSKTYGVPGWRMGYATGPADLLDKMRMLQQFSFVCAPAPFQYAIAEAAFDLDMSDWIDAYREKRDRLVAELHPSYELVPPGGSFYAFPKFPGQSTEATFQQAAIESKLLVVPGSAFSRRDTHFRLSFAAPDSEIERGLGVLNELAERFA
ncbi:MAG: pyridoxal phosphate-dependent aminotransferase [Planctomycetes bacterium]|nr:pyridoxal phosphate-dependent aminotransferase [Planctomycetota bacterium]